MKTPVPACSGITVVLRVDTEELARLENPCARVGGPFRHVNQRKPGVQRRSQGDHVGGDDIDQDALSISLEARSRALVVDLADFAGHASGDESGTRRRLVLELESRVVRRHALLDVDFLHVTAALF